MRSAHFKATALALAILSSAVALARAGVDVRPTSETNGQIVVRVDNHLPPNFSPVKTFYVAIGPNGTYSANFFSGPPASSLRGAAAAPPLKLDTLTVSTPFNFRGVRVLRIKIQIPGNTPVAHVIVNYTPAATVANAATADPLVKQLVLNESIFPMTPASGAPSGWFSRAAGWAKLAVTDRGMYVVYGSDLSGTGVNLGGIDPSTLRLYSQGGIEQQRDLTDPRGSWRADQAMREVAIRVEAGGDGTFDPGDRIIFYGIGTQDWADYYSTTAPDTVFQQHERATTNYYYLAWGGALPGAPVSISDVDATPAAGPDRTTYTQREYRERDLLADFDYRGDGWLWLDIQHPGTSFYNLGSVTGSDVVPSVSQQFLSIGLAPYDGQTNNQHHALFIRRHNGLDTVIGGKTWETLPGQSFYEDGVPIHIRSNFMVEGDNTILFQVPGDVNPKDKIRMAWYAIWYERRIAATGDAAMFSTPDTTASMSLMARRFSLSGTMYAFDVTDMWNPMRLTNTEVATTGSERTVRVGVDVTGRHRQLWVGTPNGFKKPAVSRFSPVDLRADVNGPNMVIITHRDFRTAADRLRAYRAAHLPLYANPSVKLVSTDDVYDNFSGGMPDPMGLRNYIKYLYDNYTDATGNHRLAYVLLLGDATEDFQNHASSQPDFVPANLYFTQQTLFAYSTDEWYAHLDPADQQSGHGIDDVAVGRLPAASVEEASFLVDKVIGYETGAPLDDWKHRYILVADDENSSFKGACETEWTEESELITRFHAPDFLTAQKIYLTEYPEIAGVKPTSRLAFIDAWNAGALLINYIGHGSSVQMADEQVFLASDVSQLVNGERLPILTAFSCTIGDFANPAGKSLSEKLLLRDGGGVIATVTAARETYPDPNSRVCFSLFEELFPTHLGRPATPTGVALMHAKLFGLADTNWYYFQEENNWKYNLMGDPALTLQIPDQEIHWNIPDPDTLVAGLRHTLKGQIYSGNGGIDTGFNGPVSVTVREPDKRQTYITDCAGGIPISYLLPGGPIYKGTVDAKNGQFQVSFRVPRYAATGDLAFAGSYAHNDARDAANSVDSVLVVVPPTLADSLALRPVDGPPRVDLGFKSGLKVVKAGDTVRARVRDADGINILNTTNEGRQAILIDNLPVPIDVNQYFSYDHGGTDTSGVLLYPLPDLHVGHHRLVYKVSDSFGFTTLDTLKFDVTDAANYYAEAPFNYPNPFKDSTKFLFRISNRASIKLEIYTVSGKFVRRIEETHEGGEAWIEWDGRNGSGGDVANGSYLYVATINFNGVDRPPVVLRGRLSRIR
jgi:hypothetical protein